MFNILIEFIFDLLWEVFILWPQSLSQKLTKRKDDKIKEIHDDIKRSKRAKK